MPSTNGSIPRACIIGAGSSGIAAVKALHERSIPFDCFETSDEVGGNWVFGNRNGLSAAYRDLFIDVSRERMAYSDLPMPTSYPDFPHHTHVREYFNAYVDHFGLRDLITFNTSVEHAARREDGSWEIALDSGETRVYDALLVANGHHWDPRWPEPAFPGAEEFAGEQLHAHSYVDNSVFAGRRAVVLGIGNSAVDIAVESSYVAHRTYLAARRGAWIIPKYMFGRPVDQLSTNARIPPRIRWRVMHQLLKSYTGDPERYGLPKPDHKFGFPFFDEDLVCAPDNHIELFRRVFHPDIPGLYFIGLLQPLGAIMPLAEAQSTWVGDHLLGDYVLPSVARMRADIAADQASMRKRYVASKRHTIQVDFDDYLRDLAVERRAGAQRARAHLLPA